MVTNGSAATQAGKQATTTIPIVMIGIGDPVRAGFVASLAHPGGNIWQYHSGSGGRAQTATASQTGRSYNVACGLSLES
jgi:ABC transporter substrate binding protein